MAVPRIDKIVLNMGLGEAVERLREGRVFREGGYDGDRGDRGNGRYEGDERRDDGCDPGD